MARVVEPASLGSSLIRLSIGSLVHECFRFTDDEVLLLSRRDDELDVDGYSVLSTTACVAEFDDVLGCSVFTTDGCELGCGVTSFGVADDELGPLLCRADWVSLALVLR